MFFTWNTADMSIFPVLFIFQHEFLSNVQNGKIEPLRLWVPIKYLAGGRGDKKNPSAPLVQTPLECSTGSGRAQSETGARTLVFGSSILKGRLGCEVQTNRKVAGQNTETHSRLEIWAGWAVVSNQEDSRRKAVITPEGQQRWAIVKV